MQRGDLAEAEKRLQEVCALLRERGLHSRLSGHLIDLGRCLKAQDRLAEATAHLDRACSLAKEHNSEISLLLALAERACLPGGDASAAEQAFAEQAFAEQAKGLGATTRMDCHFLLWQASGDVDHLERAHEILLLLSKNAPEEFRESMLERVALHRDIRSAWSTHCAKVSSQAT